MNTITSPSEALEALAEISRVLAEPVDLGQVKQLHDRAELMRCCIKTAAVGLELQNQAAEVKLLAERRAGQLLAKLRKRGGDRKSEDPAYRAELDALGLSRSQSARWQCEASLPEDGFLDYVRQAKLEGRELTSLGLMRLARTHAETMGRAGGGGEAFNRLAAGLKDLVRQKLQFACIYVDPPWPATRKAKARTPRFVQKLAKLPVNSLAACQAHLHLWITPESLGDGLKLLRAWGFHYRSSLVRTKAPSDFGRYWRQAHEVLLLGVRGGLDFRDSALPSWIEGHFASATESAREIRALIERVSPAPYLDLFGTTVSTGWTAAARP